MIGEEDENGVERIIIDEKKEKFPCRMRRSNGRTHQIFPDHKVIISVMNGYKKKKTQKRKLKQL